MPHLPRPRIPARRLWCAAIGLLGVTAAAASPQTFDIDPQHTRVHWEVVHFGTSTSRGRFDDIDVRLQLDRAAGTGEVSVRVRTASVDTGVAPLDAILRGEYFFASAAHPLAHFVAKRLHFADGWLVRLDGELTLRDTSAPLSLTARSFRCRRDVESGREVCGGDFEGELRRSDFGITYGLPFVAERVKLVVQVEGVAR